MDETRDIAAGARVVVAMSGGVDSAVTAARMVDAGFDVVGVTMQLYDQGVASAPAGRARTCCAGRDVHDARRIADHLAIPHYVVDYEARFRRDVIQPFAESYARGETPIPCVLCNQTVKFRDLLAMAERLGAAALATGHYVRRVVEEGDPAPALYRARDAARDQSYFLFATTPAQLARLRFPLGDETKPAVRAEALRRGLPVADKPDSQDICFAPFGDYARVVERLRPDACAPGDIVDMAGRVLGRHQGIAHFTIGQRRGLGIGGGAGASEPSYVVRIEAVARRVVVGPREALAVTRVALRDTSWLAPIEGEEEITVRLRSTMAPAPARLVMEAGGPANEAGGPAIALYGPQFGIAPGQAAVCYRGERLLGGGWIKEAAAGRAASAA